MYEYHTCHAKGQGLALALQKGTPKAQSQKRTNRVTSKPSALEKYKGSACTVLFHPNWEKLLEALGQSGAVSLNADVPPVTCFA